MSEARCPRLPSGFRLRHDPVRQAWVLLGPERLFLPDDHGLAVLQLVDGVRSVGAIVDDLAALYDAPRAVIAADVEALLDQLAAGGAVIL